jgi:hypothetical protein
MSEVALIHFMRLSVESRTGVADPQWDGTDRAGKQTAPTAIWTGDPGSHQRTWAEKDGRSPSAALSLMEGKHWKNPLIGQVRWCEPGSPVQIAVGVVCLRSPVSC